MKTAKIDDEPENFAIIAEGRPSPKPTPRRGDCVTEIRKIYSFWVGFSLNLLLISAICRPCGAKTENLHPSKLNTDSLPAGNSAGNKI